MSLVDQWCWQAHLGGEAEALQGADVHPGEVRLAAAPAVAGGMGIGVVGVVPALTEGDRGHPGVVAEPSPLSWST